MHEDNFEETRQNNILSRHHTPTIQINQHFPANQRHKHDYFHQSSSKYHCNQRHKHDYFH
jgi:hypothetical protein